MSNYYQNKKHLHKHLSIAVLALGLGVLFGIFIYPKLAIQGNPPSAPTGLNDKTDGTVIIGWDPAPEGESVSFYRIFYSPENNISDKSGDSVAVTNDFRGSPSYEFNGELDSHSEVYYFAIIAVNEVGDSELSDVIMIEMPSDSEEITIDDDPSVTSTTDSTATITWTTNVAASSRVYYGPTENIKGTTPEANVSPRVTNHETVITGLVSCMTYWFKAESFDVSGNSVQSLGGEFKTRGCKGDSDIVAHDIQEVSPSAGATVEAGSGGRTVTVVAPAAVLDGTTIAIEALKLEQEKVSLDLPAPTRKTWAGDNIYSLKALQAETEEVETNFEIPVEVSMDYTSEDVQGLNLSTLKIYHYTEGTGWEVLSNCENDYDALGGTGTITCETDHFSYFGLFGEEESENSNSVSSGNKPDSTSVVVKNSEVETPVVVSPVQVEGEEDSKINQKFTQDLWYGAMGPEVKMLQSLLNKLGFIVSQSGYGSTGNETEYFGPKTRDALILFQEAYKQEVLAPLGLLKGTGFFGIYSRTKANSLK